MNSRLNILAVPASLTIALMLVMLPWPEWAEAYRPDWVTLIAIYWAIALPRRFGLFWAWCFGLLLDVTQGSLLGQHALGMVVAIYLANRFHQRIRVYPLGQQGFVVLILLLLKQSIVLWVNGITGKPPENLWIYYAPSVLGMFLWPLIFIVLRDLRRKYKLS